MILCNKCGNPKRIYWCKHCESTSEHIKCDNCGKKATLDKNYHEACLPLESKKTRLQRNRFLNVMLHALNLIDEQASYGDNGTLTTDEIEARAKAYELLADFITNQKSL